jgi:hypothetical protein
MLKNNRRNVGTLNLVKIFLMEKKETRSMRLCCYSLIGPAISGMLSKDVGDSEMEIIKFQY